MANNGMIKTYNLWRQETSKHDHLDGGFPLMTVLPELHRLSGKPYPFRGSFAEQHAAVKAIFANPQIDIVERFSNTTGVMQSQEALSLAAYAHTCVRAKQGFRYCEATVAPHYHVNLKGFKNFDELLAHDPIYAEREIKNVVAALVDGIKRGEAEYPGIEANLLLTFGRELDPTTAVFLMNVFAECDRHYCVGVGLVCDESKHPPQKHIPAFRLAKKLGFKISIHAGEWVSEDLPSMDELARLGEAERFETIMAFAERDKPQRLENIHCAIVDLGADRIGHAISLADKPDLMRLVKDRGIGIELCPGSNFASGLIPDMAYLGIRRLLKEGILCSIEHDDDLFLPNLDETFQLLQRECGFSDAEHHTFNINGWKTRFGKRKYAVIPAIA